MKFASIFLILLLLIAGGTYWYLSSGKSEELPVQEVQEDVMAPVEGQNDLAPDIASTEVTETQEKEQEIPLPSLDESTPWVKESMKAILTHPVFEAFFTRQEVVRQFVVAIDRLSRGDNPFKQMSYLHPGGKFEVNSTPDSISLSDENFRRFTPLITALEALPQNEMMMLYGKLEPVLVEAYGELGNVDTWGDALKRASLLVEEFSYPQRPVALVGSKGGYVYRDNAIEQAPWVHKFLVRVGPEHSEKLKKLVKRYFMEWEENFPKKKIDKESDLE